ncbi:MAG: hypothetical protein ABSB39_23705 [Candidatus Sulfotelmatobacter sp.]|jgi:hypothetical protein
MRQVGLALAACLVAGTFAAGQESNPTSGTKSKKPSAEAVAARLSEMQKAIEAQQQQIQHLVEQVQSRDGQIQELEQQMSHVQSSASQAQQAAEAATSRNAQEEQNITAIRSDISGLKSTAGDTALTIQETQKNVNASLENPLAVHYKGITITPGGFLAAEFVRRSRALAADVNTPFNSLTMPGASQSSLSEFFGSGRQSRISMLAEGRLQRTKLSGYVEADFLSASASSNNNQSNSYSLRQRQAWGQVALDNGFTFTGGQMWSLVTETKHGVDNRSEALPMTIDAQYTVGFSWARQYGLRVSKSFHDKAWLAVAIENPQATLTTHNNGDNFLLGSAGASGGLFNAAATSAGANLANYSFNPSPDVVAKLAFEPGFGHYEVFGVYSRFRDRVFPCGEVASSATLCGGSTVAGANALGASNDSKNGGGIGANARWSFDNKHLDFGLHAFGGSGVGRYGTGGLPDASIHANGTLDLIKSYQALGTLEWHGPKLDVYTNAGVEYAGRAADFDPVSGKYVGYGSPLFSNSGCFTEIAPTVNSGFTPTGLSSCTADTRVLVEGTFGIWFKPYDGSKEKVNRGRIQWGPQFSYVDRNTWSGVGGEPHGLDGMIFTSFRYYLP